MLLIYCLLLEEILLMVKLPSEVYRYYIRRIYSIHSTMFTFKICVSLFIISLMRMLSSM
jgi:hypothetical protein